MNAVGDSLVGVYVHGSAALGGWVLGASDLDILVVVTSDTSPADLAAVAQAACRATPTAPTSGLELSVIGRDLAESPRAPWPFLLHVATYTSGKEPRVVHDSGAGDLDLLMHIAVAREAGIRLLGPEPAELLGTVQRDDVLTYLRGELRWGANEGPEKYAVLNACRALTYLETDAMVSKIDGGVWALSHLPQYATLIGRALQDQRGGSASGPCSAGCRALVDEVIQRIETETASSSGTEGSSPLQR